MKYEIDKYIKEIAKYGIGPENIGEIFGGDPMDASIEPASLSLDKIHTRIVIRGAKVLLSSIAQTCDPTVDKQRALLGGILTEEMLNATSPMMNSVYDVCKLQLMPIDLTEADLFERSFQSLRIQVEDGMDPFTMYVIVILQQFIAKAIQSRRAILSSTSLLLQPLRNDIEERIKNGFDYPIAIFEDDEDSQPIYLRDLQEALCYATAVEESECNLHVSASNRPYMTFQDEQVITYIVDQDNEIARLKEEAIEKIKAIYEDIHENVDKILLELPTLQEQSGNFTRSLVEDFEQLKLDLECVQKGTKDSSGNDVDISDCIKLYNDLVTKLESDILQNKEDEMLGYVKSSEQRVNAVGQEFVQKVKALDLWRAEMYSISSFSLQDISASSFDYTIKRTRDNIDLKILTRQVNEMLDGLLEKSTDEKLEREIKIATAAETKQAEVDEAAKLIQRTQGVKAEAAKDKATEEAVKVEVEAMVNRVVAEVLEKVAVAAKEVAASPSSLPPPPPELRSEHMQLFGYRQNTQSRNSARKGNFSRIGERIYNTLAVIGSVLTGLATSFMAMFSSPKKPRWWVDQKDSSKPTRIRSENIGPIESKVTTQAAEDELAGSIDEDLVHLDRNDDVIDFRRPEG